MIVELTDREKEYIRTWLDGQWMALDRQRGKELPASDEEKELLREQDLVEGLQAKLAGRV